MKIPVTWGEICAKGLAMEVIELKNRDVHGAQNVPTDEVIELTVKQAQNLGLLSEE